MDAKAMLAEVRTNLAILDACPSHDFSIDADPSRQMFKRWKCSRCGGVVDHHGRRWYVLGLKHAEARK